jgi:hypothetical protein
MLLDARCLGERIWCTQMHKANDDHLAYLSIVRYVIGGRFVKSPSHASLSSVWNFAKTPRRP